MPDPIRRPSRPPQAREQWSALGTYLAQEASIAADRPNQLASQMTAALRALHHLAFQSDLDWETLLKVASVLVHYDLNVTEADNA